MKKWILPVAAVALFAGCNNPGEKITDGDKSAGDSAVVKTPSTTADTSIAGCYSYISARDTVAVQLDKKGDNLRGQLSFNYYEKDRNDGVFEGAVEGDIISGFYLFRSEGVMSVRQEIFRYNNGKLIPASGEVVQRNDSTFYKDPASLRFDESRALTKEPCVL